MHSETVVQFILFVVFCCVCDKMQLLKSGGGPNIYFAIFSSLWFIVDTYLFHANAEQNILEQPLFSLLLLLL